MKKVLLGIFLVLSLGWIVYFSLETMGISNTYDPSQLFGINDASLLIVNRQDEIKPGSIKEIEGSPCEILYNDLNDSSFTKAYISLGQPHLLLIRKSGWSGNEIETLFKSLQVKNLIESDGSFEVGEFQGRYSKQGLYMHKEGVEFEKGQSSVFEYDKKASAAIIDFKAKDQVTDIYLRDNDRYDYISKTDAIENWRQVADEELFSSFVSGNVRSYHFYERDYYKSIDSIYTSGPMYNWLNSGFVLVSTSSGNAIVSDYILGQDPILNLRDVEQNDTLNRFTIQLTSNFPGKGKSYYIDYLEDLIIISENKAVVDQLLADHKLGKTISSNEGLRVKLYEHLPHMVSERYIDGDNSYSKAYYNGHILIARTNPSDAEVTVSERKNFTMNIGAQVKDFEVLNGDGNVVAADRSNKLTLFLKGIKEWSKDLPSEIEHLQVTDIYANGNQQICAQTYNQVFLYDTHGKNIGAYPIKLDYEITSEVSFYRWKNSGYFVFGTSDGKAHIYDSQGREIRVIDAGLIINRAVDTWSSQGRLFLGFANDNTFHMYDADKRRMHRKFDLGGRMLTGKVPNEIFQFGYQNGALVRVDQKGTKSTLQSYPQGKILMVKDENKNPVIVLKSLNEIKLINNDGLEIGSVKLPFNEVAGVDLTYTDNGKTILSVIDGLENNVYLYGVGGNLLSEKPLEGQGKVDVRLSGPQKKITTIVDQFVVQYFEN